MKKKFEGLKLLHGTNRPDRAENGGLKVETAIPECPVSLSDEARVIWDDLSKKLVDLKVLTQLDGYVLTLFCETYVRWNALRLFLQANGDSYQSENGLHKIRPEVQSLKECLNSLDILTAKLCLSPEDRGRVSVPNSVKPNPLEDFLKKGCKNER